MGSSHHFLLSFCCFRKICYIKWIKGTQKIIFKTKLWKWMQAGCEIWDVCLVWLLNLSSGPLWQELVPREAQLGSHWAFRRSILSKRNPPFVSLVSDYHSMSILTLNPAPIHSPCPKHCDQAAVTWISETRSQNGVPIKFFYFQCFVTVIRKLPDTTCLSITNDNQV